MDKFQLFALEQLSHQTPRQLQAANPELFTEISTLAGQTASAARLQELMDVPIKDNPLLQGELRQAQMHCLGDLCELSQRKVKAVLARGLTVDTLDDQSLKSLVAEKRLKDSDARQLGLAAGLFRLFDGDLALTHAVMKKRLPDFGNHRARQLRELATLDTAQWEKILRKEKIVPPENTSLEEYAEVISRKVAALYPTDSYFVRLAPVRAEELSKQIKRVAPLFEQEAAVFNKPGFEKWAAERLEFPEFEAFRLGYEKLTRQARQIPASARSRFPFKDILPAGGSQTAAASAPAGVALDALAPSPFERFEAGRFKPKTLARMHATYTQLKRVANRYHGLGLAKLLDDPQLTPEQKAEQVATRVGWVEQVRAQNPDVELLKLDYSPDSADLAALRLDGLDEAQQSMVLAALRTGQRVYALTRDVDHARAILEAGYISATSIACDGFAAFVESTGLDPDAARRCYEAARQMTVTVGAGLGAVLDSARGGFHWLNVCNTGENRRGVGLVKLDDYETLFGSQTYCDCKHCQSILSPAAYFVDLVSFLLKNVSPEGVARLFLFRPDLLDLELTCENTDTEIPALEIINQILGEMLVKTLPGSAAQQEQAILSLQALGNFKKPFLPALEKLEGCLGHFGLERAGIVREMSAAPDLRAMARLGLLEPDEYRDIARGSTVSIDLAVLSLLYGLDFSVDPLTKAIVPIDVQEFLKPLGISRPELDDLVKTRFVNGGLRLVPQKRSAESVQFDIEKVEGLTPEVLDRIRRFLRLWHRLPEIETRSGEARWTILELDLALRLLGSSAAASWSIDLESLTALIALQERFRLPLFDACGLWCRDLQDIRLASQPASTSLFERLFNPPALAQAGAPFPRAGELFVHPAFLEAGEEVPEGALQRLQAGLKVNDEELVQLIARLEKPLCLDLAGGKTGFLLTAENLSLLYRHARLAKLLKLPIPQLFQALQLSAPGTTAIADLAGLVAFLDFHDWRQASGYKPDELGFITGGKVLSPDVYPDPAAIAGQVPAKVRADKSLEFASTLFAFLDGVTEAQSRRIIDENPDIFEAVNAGRTIFCLASRIDPRARLTIPDEVIKSTVKAKTMTEAEAEVWLKEETWTLLLKYHASQIIPTYLAALLNVPAEKMDRLVTMTGADLFDPLFARILNGEAVPIEPLESIVDRILRLNVLFGKATFDPLTLDFILDHQALFSIADLANIDMTQVRKLSVYLSMTDGADAAGPADVSSFLLDLAAWLAAPSGPIPDSLAEELARVLQTESSLVQPLLNSLPLPRTAPEAAMKLATCVKLARQIGVAAPVLPAIASNEYQQLGEAGESVLAAYKAGYQDEAEWQAQITPLEDRLRSGRRDVLCHALIHFCRAQGVSISRNDIYDLFLIDPELEGCARTSKVVAAISSLQLYIQRILMNLESIGNQRIVPLRPEMAQEWEWRKNYRVWEANRKVFLYPENYIEPDLRDDKTPLFEELESKLLQQQITPQNVLDAYGSYLTGFEEAARLKIAGAYHDIGTDADTLHLFGVTPDNPPTYYYRAVSNIHQEEKDPATHGIDWSHWRKVDVQIPVRKVSPIVYKGRLYVFWVEMTTLPKNDVSDGKSRFVGYKHKMALKYTTLRLDGTWAAPQTLSLTGKDVFPGGEGIIDDPLQTPEESETLLKLTLDLQDKLKVYDFEAVRKAKYKVDDYLANEMASPLYDPGHKHLEPMDGYTLTGFLWDQVYPSVKDQALVVTGRDYRLRGAIDFYGKTITPNSSSAAGKATITLPCVFPASRTATFIPLSEGKVLEWSPDDVTWRLWKYYPGQTSGKFPGFPLAQGQWSAALAGCTPFRMPDVKLLNREASTGEWKLWDFTPTATADGFRQTIRQGLPFVAGQAIQSIKDLVAAGHTLLPVDYGKVLRWRAADGSWALLEYVPIPPGDLGFTTEPIFKTTGAAGRWSDKIGHHLVPMTGGKVLEWAESDGAWRLWSLNPLSPNLLPEPPLASGTFGESMSGHSLVPMPDGKVLDWSSAEGIWRLFAFNPGGNGPVLQQYSGNEQGGGSQAGHSLLARVTASLPYDDYPTCTILSRWENLAIYNSFRGPAEWACDPIHYSKIAELNMPAEIAAINGSIREGVLRESVVDIQGDLFLLQRSENIPLGWSFKRIGTGMGEAIVRKLFGDGIDAMLSIQSQEALHEGELPFIPSNIADGITQENCQGNHFDFRHGPYGVYYREIFFHTPFLIANHLNSQGRFADARRWYQYIFDPTSGEETTPVPQDHNWRYLEFRNPIPSWRSILTDPEMIAVYKKDPFNPHAIARLRISAYQKAIVMKYLDNLLDWADSLFSQFTRESINEATMLYIMAAEILGERPAEFGECGEGGLKPKSVRNIFSHARGEILLEYPAALETRVLGRAFPGGDKLRLGYDYLPNASRLLAAGKTTLTPLSTHPAQEATGGAIFHAYDWRKLPAAAGDLSLTGKQSPLIQDPALIADFSTSLIQSACSFNSETGQGWDGESRPVFCIPANDELIGYWDRVEDRLYKIRHCLDIDGVRRDLALFAPPIDPHLLVRMKAAGLSIEDVLGTSSGNLPPYRFAYLIEKARQYAGTLQGFGAALLNALERKDVEELNRLRTVHEQNILKLTRQVRQWEIDAEAETIKALERQKDSITYRKEYYQELIEQRLTSWEIINQQARHFSSGLKGTAAVFDTVAAIMYLNPQYGSPFSMKYGGDELGHSGVTWSELFRSMAGIYDSIAESAGLEATFQRRAQEWKHQAELANKELKQIERQLIAAEIRQKIAARVLEIHDKNIEQAKEVYDFYAEKFSSFGMYTWLSTRLQALHREAYQGALSMARLAERAYRFERDDDTSMLLDANYWDASHAGLLAGEQLSIALQNMERKFIETNYRTFEIDQAVSLAQVDPTALVCLRETGNCEFEIPEAVFDLPYPGHYRRVIKAVRLTIPCVTGPYTNVGATLRLSGSQVRVEARTDAAALKDVPLQRSVCIATSRAQADAGVFELNFRDERYMPFEGAGAVSGWKLELPSLLRSFDYNTISDVILHISYTAKDGAGVIQNGRTFKENVELSIVDRLGGLCRLVSLKHEFPTAFYQLLHGPGAEFELDVQHFPHFLFRKDLELSGVGICLLTGGKQAVSTTGLKLQIGREDKNGANPAGRRIDAWSDTLNGDSLPKIKVGSGSISGNPVGIWKVSITGGTLAANDLDDVLVLLNYNVQVMP